jgi:hypothetical protein
MCEDCGAGTDGSCCRGDSSAYPFTTYGLKRAEERAGTTEADDVAALAQASRWHTFAPQDREAGRAQMVADGFPAWLMGRGTGGWSATNGRTTIIATHYA